VARCPELFDVLNVHSYAQLEGWPTWRRSYPEDPKLPHYLQDVTAVCQWRDTHAPDKPVWSRNLVMTAAQNHRSDRDFAKWIGVNDTQQAQWLVRSLLVFSAMPIERAYIFFFNDETNRVSTRARASPGISSRNRPTMRSTTCSAFWGVSFSKHRD